MADYHGPRQFAVYRNRDLCLETQEADVVLVSTILGAMNMAAGGIFLMAGCFIGLPVLPIVYGKIYRKYKA